MKIINENNFEEEISSGIILVDFYADWCGPCRMLAPVLDAMSTENPDVKFLAVNVEANPALAQRFDVQSIPCLIFFKNGVELTRQVGFTTKTELNRILKEIKA
jgi:thioredoxin 1